jgi:hypothetical protein
VRIKDYLTIKGGANRKEPIFDVDTAIEVCCQQESTREEAEKLAQAQQRWKLLVKIYIESGD